MEELDETDDGKSEIRACEVRAVGFQWVSLCFTYPTEVIQKAQNEVLDYLLSLAREHGEIYDLRERDESEPICEESLQAWREQLNGQTLEDRQMSYLRVFKRVTPYESEHTAAQALLPTDTIADVAGFYRAFGFEMREGTERADHIGAELQFMALLAVKETEARRKKDIEGVAVCVEAQQKFLAEHLGPFVLALEKHLSEDPEGNGGAGEWILAAQVARKFVENLAREWGISILPAEGAPIRVTGILAERLSGESIQCPFALPTEDLSEN